MTEHEDPSEAERSKPFDLWLVPHPNNHWPREYMQLTYNGDEGKYAMEFSRREVDDLKATIARWEASFYA
jgi:hypothetical protein